MKSQHEVSDPLLDAADQLHEAEKRLIAIKKDPKSASGDYHFAKQERDNLRRVFDELLEKEDGGA